MAIFPFIAGLYAQFLSIPCLPHLSDRGKMQCFNLPCELGLSSLNLLLLIYLINVFSALFLFPSPFHLQRKLRLRHDDHSPPPPPSKSSTIKLISESLPSSRRRRPLQATKADLPHHYQPNLLTDSHECCDPRICTSRSWT